MLSSMTSAFNPRNITISLSQERLVATHIISAVAKVKVSSPLIAFTLLCFQCALLHPSFAHSRLSRMIRISLTPINFFTMLSLSFQCISRPAEPSDMLKDMFTMSFMWFMAIKSLEWGFAKGSYYTRSLVQVNGVERWEKVKGSDEAYKKLQEAEPCNVFKLASWTLLQVTSFRGLQFTYGPAIAANNQSTFELLWRMFRVNTCLSIALSFLVLTRDASLGTPKSALLSLGVPNFPGLNLLSETLYTACFGIWVACSVDNMFNSLTLLATCAHKIAISLNCPQDILELCDPKYFPSAFDSPHKSSSIAHFWGKGWHTILQRMFLISGGLPIAWLVKRLGASHRVVRLAGMFGVFASSAFLHEYGALRTAQRVNPNLDLSTWVPGSIIYFMLQPLAILVEPFVIPLIPQRLGGGRLWVWTFGLLAAFPFRDQFLVGMRIHQDVPPLEKWSMIYMLKPVKM